MNGKLEWNTIRSLISVIFLFVSVTSCGSGGGDDGGGEPADNSRFYGTYKATLTTGDCDPVFFSLTIGDDESQRQADGYLYIPLEESSDTSDNGVLTISGDTISIDLVQDDGDAMDLDFVFNDDYSSIRISGTITGVKPVNCSGKTTGSAERTEFNKVSFPITVRAKIDGVSQLKIQASMLWWHHISWEPPGLWEDDDAATFLNGEAWYPVWPFKDLTDCNCDSSLLDALESPLPEDSANLAITIVSARGAVVIVQQPNQDNDHTAIIEFDDHYNGELPGPAWYEIIIHYDKF
jgi:hypothetical protein